MDRIIAKARKRQAELLAHSDLILATAEREGRDITPPEQRLLDGDRKELDATAEIIGRQNALNEERRNTMPTMKTGFEDFSFAGDPGAATATATAAPPRTCKGGVVGATYAKLFGVSTDTEGWQNPSEFFNGVHVGLADQRFRMMSGGDGPGGGFLVPTAFSPMMLDSIIESSIILPRCRVFPMSTNELRVPGFDTSTAASGVLYGGITQQWLGEGETAIVTNPMTRQIRLIAKKLGLLISVTNELSADALDLASQITDALRAAGSWYIDDALLNGSGAGMPRGILQDSACIEASKEAGQDPDTLIVENLHSMFCRMHPSCLPNSLWIVSVTTIPQLMSLSIPIGLAGQHVKVLNETDGKFSMLSRPVIFSEKMASLGDRGDILLVDPTQYSVGVRSELSIEKSAHLYFASDQTAYRALVRLDGMGTWNGVYQPKNGATLSWAITLEVR